MLTARANLAFLLHRIAGRRLALAAMQPLLVVLVDAAAGMRNGAVLAELLVEDDAAAFAGVRLDEAFPEPRSTRVLGLERGDAELLGLPGTPCCATGIACSCTVMRMSPKGCFRIDGAAGPPTARPRAPEPAISSSPDRVRRVALLRARSGHRLSPHAAYVHTPGRSCQKN